MIIFLYGEDTYRSRQKLKELKTKFTKEIDQSQSSLDVLDGEKISLEGINEIVAAPSLFAKRRMVIIENIFKNKDKDLFKALADYLKKKNLSDADKDAIIIFWEDNSGDKLKTNVLFKNLCKEKIVQEFKLLSNTETVNWVKAEAKRRGGNMKGQAAVQLASIFGSDLWQLSNEINKLINFKRGQAPGMINVENPVDIELKDVEDLVRGSTDENIFALTDAISIRNKAKALELFENELKAGVTEAYLLSMIIRQFKILIQVHEAINSGYSPRKIQSELKLHPYVVQKTSASAKNFSLNALKELYSQTVDIDYQLKTGQADIKTALSLMISKI
jgi:DNA polymerase-3 subunit delta